MEIKELLQQAEERMNKSIEALKHEFASIRTGRASVALLDKVMVDYYGSPTPINQVANISVPEPRMIVIAPWDKTMIGAIEKAILQSDLGLNPGNDGAQIRLTIPQLTEERRKEIVKVVHKKAEDAKVAVRNIRRRAIRHLEKKRIVIFGAGLGKPYFSTDTTAALRAAEIEADAILMAKKFADGVYDSDPKTNPNAVKFDELTYNDIITKELKVMDATSTTLCKDNNIPIIVFSMDIPGNITKAAKGEEIGTIVRGE